MDARSARPRAVLLALVGVASGLLLACGGGGGGGGSTPPLGSCGPSAYAAVELVNDNQVPAAPAGSASSPPRCDQVLQSDFFLVFAPAGADYRSFRFRESFVPGSGVVQCPGVTRVTTNNPLVSGDIRPPSLAADGWVDLNGLNLALGLETLLPSGCSLRAAVLDQWSFPSTTANLPGAQAACGGSFDADGWQTFATKVNFLSRTGSVIQSCKTMDGGPVGACQYFDLEPRLSLTAAASAPAAGGTLGFRPRVVVATPSTHTCRLWSATSNTAFIHVDRQSPRKDAGAVNELVLRIDPNPGPPRVGTVAVGFGGTAGPALLEIHQDGTQPPACVSVAGSGWVVTGTATRTCSGSLATQGFTNTESGARSITLYQNGCLLSENPNFPSGESYTITGSTTQASTPMFLVGLLPPGTVLTQNQTTTFGTIRADLKRIDWASTGQAAGTIAGVPGSCEFSSQIVFAR